LIVAFAVFASGERLELDGYIESYRAALRRDRDGLGFLVFLGVKMSGHANKHTLLFEKSWKCRSSVSGEAD